MTLATLPAPAGDLTAEQRDVIDFFAYVAPEYANPDRAGQVLPAVREWLDMDFERAGQILAQVIDNPDTITAALAYDGAAVMRLRDQRDARSARRLPRRRLSDVPAGTS